MIGEVSDLGLTTVFGPQYIVQIRDSLICEKSFKKLVPKMNALLIGFLADLSPFFYRAFEFTLSKSNVVGPDIFYFEAIRNGTDRVALHFIDRFVFDGFFIARKNTQGLFKIATAIII